MMADEESQEGDSSTDKICFKSAHRSQAPTWLKGKDRNKVNPHAQNQKAVVVREKNVFHSWFVLGLLEGALQSEDERVEFILLSTNSIYKPSLACNQCPPRTSRVENILGPRREQTWVGMQSFPPPFCWVLCLMLGRWPADCHYWSQRQDPQAFAVQVARQV